MSRHVFLCFVILRSVRVSMRKTGRDGDKDHRCVLVVALAFTMCHL